MRAPKLNAWEEMQAGRALVAPLREEHRGAPREPEHKAPWWIKGSTKFHYARRYMGDWVVCACGFTTWRPLTWSQAPPHFDTCLQCLARLARLPSGVYPDDIALEARL